MRAVIPPAVAYFLLTTLPGLAPTIAAANAALQTKIVDVAEEVDFDYVNVSGDREKSVILSSLGGGAAVFDYDGDGDLDVFFVNGARLDVASGEQSPGSGNRLYRNEGAWHFSDVTESAGLTGSGWAVGVSAGDIDNDGATDLYVTKIGPNAMYRGRGDGTFEDVSETWGAAHDGFGTSAAFFDSDADGDLDLYVTNYVDPDLAKIPPPGAEPTCTWLGMDVMCGPRGLGGQADVFYRNEDGRFVEATAEAGLHDSTKAFGLGVMSLDFDDDGDRDLYVANDTMPNFVYRNDGTGRFDDVGLLSGAAYNGSGETEAGMGIDFADVDGDGSLDMFVTNFSHETNTLYLASGQGWFDDRTEELSLGSPSLGRLGWGTRFSDWDLDGDRDIFVANGHVYPNVERVDSSTTYRQRNQLFWNDGRGRFEEASSSAVVEVARSSRGVAVGDLDEDGDPDAVVVNIDDVPHVYRNELDSERAWVGLLLVGRESNRSAEGSRVTLVVSVEGERVELVEEVHACGSIFSSSDPRIVFGLTDGARVEALHVDWPSGKRSTLGGDEGKRYRVIVEPAEP